MSTAEGNGLPPGWAAVPLAALAEVRLGRQRSPDRAQGPHMRRYVRAANVRWDGISTEYVNEMDFNPEEFETFRLRSGDILIVEGSGSASEVGKPAIWNDEVPDCCFQNTLIRVRAPEHLVPFLHRHFQHDARSGAFARSSRGIGIHHIGAKALESWGIALPPLNEQKRIVAKIEVLQARSDAAKEALDAIPPLLEKFRQSVLAAAFRGDLTKKWREQHPDTEPASKLLERIRAERRRRWEEANPRKKYVEPDFSDDPEAPTAEVFGPVRQMGWAASALECLVDPAKGIPYGIVQTGEPVPDGVPTVRCGDIKGFGIDLGALKRVHRSLHQQYLRTALVGGEVLIAVRGTVGATAVASTDMAGMNISREVAMIPLMDGVVPRYIMYLLASPPGQRLVFGHVKGVAQAGINLRDLRRLPIPLPTLDEQNRIVSLVDAAFAAVAGIEDRCGEIHRAHSTLSQSILAKAFRGELVPQDPNDEPASVLLERIRREREAECNDGAAGKRGRRAKVAP